VIIADILGLDGFAEPIYQVSGGRRFARGGKSAGLILRPE
jgi:hypothetical protein